MTDWLVLMCDEGHSWEALDDGESQMPLCPFGHEPVTIRRMPPADRVVARVVPAARIADVKAGAVDREDLYFLEIEPVDGESHLRTQTPVSWQAAIERASLFRHASWQDASRLWLRLGGMW